MTILLSVVTQKRKMFTGKIKYGKRHRASGAFHLMILLIYTMQLNYDIFLSRQAIGPPMLLSDCFALDTALGVSGIILTLTAACDFRSAHQDARINNAASGALDDASTITVGEMLEHSFYQIINLVQIVFIHTTPSASFISRMAGLFLVTSPWIFRRFFSRQFIFYQLQRYKNRN